jgi:hypothetical protein
MGTLSSKLHLLEPSQRDPLDLTSWLTWFLAYLGRSLTRAELILGQILNVRLLTYLLNGHEGKATLSQAGAYD